MIDFETICTQKLLVNLTKNYNEMVSNALNPILYTDFYYLQELQPHSAADLTPE